MAKQQGLNIVVSKDEEMNTEKLLPEAKVAPMLPTHSPALPVQAAALRQLLDDAPQQALYRHRKGRPDPLPGIRHEQRWKKTCNRS